MMIEFGSEQQEFIPWRPEMGRVFESPFAFDTETTLIEEGRPWVTPAYILGAVSDGRQGYFVQREHVAEFLEAHRTVAMVFHNAPFDLAVLNVVVKGVLDVYEWVEQNLAWDTHLLHQLLTLGAEGHTGRGTGSLETCALEYAGWLLPKDALDSEGDVVRISYAKWLGKAPAAIEPVYLEYLAKDAWATIRVFNELQERLKALLDNSRGAFNHLSKERLNEQIERWGPQTHHIQLKGAVVLRELTSNGICVDGERATTMGVELNAYRDNLSRELRGYGYVTGPGSMKALQDILLKEAEKVPGVYLPRTSSGKLATSEEALEPLRDVVPFVDKFLEHRTVNKLITTYVGKMSRETLHPKFCPLVASGRTSSYGDINAQNLPKRDEHGIRNCIVPRRGYTFLGADYATLELATLAQTVQSMFDKPSAMGRRINEGQDLHRVVAAAVTGKPEAEVTKDERQKCKAINFGKPGGMGTSGLIQYAKTAYSVDLSEDEAAEIEQSWFGLFPEMKRYLDCRLDAGEELAHLLELTPAAFAEATGSRRYDSADDYKPAGWLGGMCLKVLEEPVPTKKTGMAYTPEEIDYFWQQLEDNIDYLPEELHAQIVSRRPSYELRYKVRNFVTMAPVFTSTGRLKANATYCQQRNTPFQGLAADGAKLALWYLWRNGFRIVNFIHDEVLIEVREGADLVEAAREVNRLMVQAMQEVVPDITIKVECSTGSNWGEMARLDPSQTTVAAPRMAA